MCRHCLSGYLPKQVEKICLQNNCIELNSRDVKALGTLYGPYGKAPSERGPFFRSQYMKGQGNLSLQFVKGPIGLIGAFYGSENDKKTSWFSELFIFKRQFS